MKMGSKKDNALVSDTLLSFFPSVAAETTRAGRKITNRQISKRSKRGDLRIALLIRLEVSFS
jgi:hypothetical protein